ncbi:MAG TPA: Crp/Fnr family transcriptional regulator [Candidatus Limnocylindria bacterium]|nr:Crp/Fnr family transcriptional regulator [Candidatus Limnocylindria bacterium]
MAVGVASILGSVSFFAGLPPEQLEELSRSLQRRTVRAGKAIFRQDDPGSSLFIIESGVVKVQRTSPDGKEVILAILGAGDFFGELALLDGEPRSADAIAKDDSVLLTLERDDFLRYIEKDMRVATKLLAALSRRLRRTDQLVQDAAFLDVPARLARALLQLEGTEAAQGLTQSELAAMVGASRESVNRWLQFFRRRGLVEYSGGAIRVLQPDELRRHIY